MPCLNKIKVGSRQSKLAKAQVQEILRDIRCIHPEIEFDVHYVLTTGDCDKKTTLRTMGKTDFFTKEIDELVLNGTCRIGIHSAKDLPDPLPAGLDLICLTKGVDSADCLVLRENYRLDDLRSGALIATSSLRREDNVNQLREDFTFIDIRGNIEERLAKLERGEADGIVIAEAALIRLGLTHLNRIRLPFPGAEGQGQLAVLARDDDEEMRNLFACLDVSNVVERINEQINSKFINL